MKSSKRIFVVLSTILILEASAHDSYRNNIGLAGNNNFQDVVQPKPFYGAESNLSPGSQNQRTLDLGYNQPTQPNTNLNLNNYQINNGYKPPYNPALAPQNQPLFTHGANYNNFVNKPADNFNGFNSGSQSQVGTNVNSEKRINTFNIPLELGTQNVQTIRLPSNLKLKPIHLDPIKSNILENVIDKVVHAEIEVEKALQLNKEFENYLQAENKPITVGGDNGKKYGVAYQTGNNYDTIKMASTKNIDDALTIAEEELNNILQYEVGKIIPTSAITPQQITAYNTTGIQYGFLPSYQYNSGNNYPVPSSIPSDITNPPNGSNQVPLPTYGSTQGTASTSTSITTQSGSVEQNNLNYQLELSKPNSLAINQVPYGNPSATQNNIPNGPNAPAYNKMNGTNTQFSATSFTNMAVSNGRDYGNIGNAPNFNYVPNKYNQQPLSGVNKPSDSPFGWKYYGVNSPPIGVQPTVTVANQLIHKQQASSGYDKNYALLTPTLNPPIKAPPANLGPQAAVSQNVNNGGWQYPGNKIVYGASTSQALASATAQSGSTSFYPSSYNDNNNLYNNKYRQNLLSPMATPANQSAVPNKLAVIINNNNRDTPTNSLPLLNTNDGTETSLTNGNLQTQQPSYNGNYPSFTNLNWQNGQKTNLDSDQLTSTPFSDEHATPALGNLENENTVSISLAYEQNNPKSYRNYGSYNNAPLTPNNDSSKSKVVASSETQIISNTGRNTQPTGNYYTQIKYPVDQQFSYYGVNNRTNNPTYYGNYRGNNNAPSIPNGDAANILAVSSSEARSTSNAGISTQPTDSYNTQTKYHVDGPTYNNFGTQQYPYYGVNKGTNSSINSENYEINNKAPLIPNDNTAKSITVANSDASSTSNAGVNTQFTDNYDTQTKYSVDGLAYNNFGTQQYPYYDVNKGTNYPSYYGNYGSNNNAPFKPNDDTAKSITVASSESLSSSNAGENTQPADNYDTQTKYSVDGLAYNKFGTQQYPYHGMNKIIYNPTNSGNYGSNNNSVLITNDNTAKSIVVASFEAQSASNAGVNTQLTDNYDTQTKDHVDGPTYNNFGTQQYPYYGVNKGTNSLYYYGDYGNNNNAPSISNDDTTKSKVIASSEAKSTSNAEENSQHTSYYRPRTDYLVSSPTYNNYENEPNTNENENETSNSEASATAESTAAINSQDYTNLDNTNNIYSSYTADFQTQVPANTKYSTISPSPAKNLTNSNLPSQNYYPGNNYNSYPQPHLHGRNYLGSRPWSQSNYFGDQPENGPTIPENEYPVPSLSTDQDYLAYDGNSSGVNISANQNLSDVNAEDSPYYGKNNNGYPSSDTAVTSATESSTSSTSQTVVTTTYAPVFYVEDTQTEVPFVNANNETNIQPDYGNDKTPFGNTESTADTLDSGTGTIHSQLGYQYNNPVYDYPNKNRFLYKYKHPKHNPLLWQQYGDQPDYIQSTDSPIDSTLSLQDQYSLANDGQNSQLLPNNDNINSTPSSYGYDDSTTQSSDATADDVTDGSNYNGSQDNVISSPDSSNTEAYVQAVAVAQSQTDTTTNKPVYNQSYKRPLKRRFQRRRRPHKWFKNRQLVKNKSRQATTPFTTGSYVNNSYTYSSDSDEETTTLPYNQNSYILNSQMYNAAAVDTQTQSPYDDVYYSTLSSSTPNYGYYYGNDQFTYNQYTDEKEASIDLTNSNYQTSDTYSDVSNSGTNTVQADKALSVQQQRYTVNNNNGNNINKDSSSAQSSATSGYSSASRSSVVSTASDASEYSDYYWSSGASGYSANPGSSSAFKSSIPSKKFASSSSTGVSGYSADLGFSGTSGSSASFGYSKASASSAAPGSYEVSGYSAASGPSSASGSLVDVRSSAAFGSSATSGSSEAFGSSVTSESSTLDYTTASGSSAASGLSAASRSSATSGLSKATRYAAASGSSAAFGSSATSGSSAAFGSSVTSESPTSGSSAASGLSAAFKSSATSGLPKATGYAAASGSSAAFGSSATSRSSATSGLSKTTRYAAASGSSAAFGSSATSGSSAAFGSSVTSESSTSGSSAASGLSAASRSSATSGLSKATGYAAASGSSAAFGSSATSRSSAASESSVASESSIAFGSNAAPRSSISGPSVVTGSSATSGYYAASGYSAVTGSSTASGSSAASETSADSESTNTSGSSGMFGTSTIQGATIANTTINNSPLSHAVSTVLKILDSIEKLLSGTCGDDKL